MALLRKCPECGSVNMQVESEELEPYNTVAHYKCPDCGHTAKIQPMGSIGTQLFVALVAISLIGWAIFTDPWRGTFGTITFYILALLFIGYPLQDLYQALRHPVTGQTDEDEGEEDRDLVNKERNALSEKPVAYIEKGGFWRGFLTPLLVIVAVLGVASAIGFIRHLAGY